MVMPLEGIRVIELSRVVTGAYCTMLLGDMGAEVIKVEQPIKADTPRWGGGWSPVGEERRKEASSNALQRNKKSVAIDLSTEAGKEIFYKLVKKSDVILECYRPGVAKRLNIDYDTVRNLNPGIIYCSLSGYGQDGPYAHLPGHDINYISFTGVLGLIGDRDGRPVIPLNLVGDFAGGSLHAALGILLALMARQKTGEGQYVDVAMTDGVVSLISFILSNYFSTGDIPKRGETLMSGAAPMYSVYQTQDNKFISIGCLEPWLWGNLCRAMGMDDFIPHQWSIDKWPEISTEFRNAFTTKSRDEWFEMLSKQNISIAKVYDLDEVTNDPQIIHRQMIIELDYPSTGKVKQPGIAIKLSGTPGRIRSFGPILGEHTKEILMEVGYTSKEFEKLRHDGVIG